MPSRPDHYCSVCADIHGDKCPKRKSFSHRKGNRHHRGYGTKWQKLRNRIIERDKGLCQSCLADGMLTHAYAVDHITPKALGGTDDESNLQALCRPCHATKTAKEGARGGVGKKTTHAR